MTVQKRLKQQECVHRKAAYLAHGVAEEVNLDTLFPSVTVLEHRRRSRCVAPASASRLLWLQLCNCG